jgi:hypothetical protein
MALYRVEDGNWILLNYAYAHTSVQWFDARVTPGDYVLWIWNQYGTVSPVDVKITFCKFVTWNWVSTSFIGKKLFTTISVPRATTPGSYSGFVKVMCNGAQVTVPIVVTVPAKLAQAFSVEANVVNEPNTYGSGDWLYLPVKVFTFGPVMLTVTWTCPDADFDVYLINPSGEARAISVAPTVPSGRGQYWYTTTGTTMEMLSTLCLFPGYWCVGIHAIYFGNTFSQTLTVKLSQGEPICAPDSLTIKKGTSKSFTVSNKIPGTINVQTMVLSGETEHFVEQTTGTVHSFDGTYVGYDGWIIPVTPDIITLSLTLSWVGDHELHLILWDPAGRNVGQTITSGETLAINNPAIGLWTAIITIHEPGSQDYAMSVGGLRFKPLNDAALQPATFTLAPYGTQTLTITSSYATQTAGYIVYYDLATGSIYSETLLVFTRCGAPGRLK